MQAHETLAERRPAGIERIDVSHCGVCGATERVPFFSPAHVVECLACGVLYVSPRPTDEAIARFYSQSGHYDHWDAEPGRADMWRRRVERIRAFVPSGRLLDVGAGQGDFGAEARRYYEVDGTEISSEGARIAKERHGLDLRLGDLLELDLPKSSYDIITMWHVLEHVAEPRKLIERAISLLKPGGVTCIAVPNADARLRMKKAELRASIQLALGMSPERSVGFDRLDLACAEEEIHLTHFTMRTLCGFLRSLDLAITETGIDDYSPEQHWKARFRHYRADKVHRYLGLTIGDALFVAARVGRRAAFFGFGSAGR